MNEYLSAAQRLHRCLCESVTEDGKLIGPDQGVRFNRRVWRFVKSYLGTACHSDNRCYLQAQGYWVLGNWLLYDLMHAPELPTLAIQCARAIRKGQNHTGGWSYPDPEWAGRVATVEVIWGALGMLASCERSFDADLLMGTLKAYELLTESIGFEKVKGGSAIRYFEGRPGPAVPNNSTLALALFGRLAKVTGKHEYLRYCPELIDFLATSQLESGELPYAITSRDGEGRTHFQCYQYNAFELMDLAMYFEAQHDKRVLPIITKLARFLAPSVNPNGSTRFDCGGNKAEVIYNTAAIGAALGTARRLGLADTGELENQAYQYVLSHQDPKGGFVFSVREQRVLKDKHYYPRPLTMILYHLGLRAAAECSDKELRTESASATDSELMCVGESERIAL